MKELKENIFGKVGFLYKIEIVDDELYYYIGSAIFKRCDDNITIYNYNMLMESIKNNNEEDIKKYLKCVIKRSGFEKLENRQNELKMELEEFIDNLDKEQYESLEEQVKMFEEMFYKYGR